MSACPAFAWLHPSGLASEQASRRECSSNSGHCSLAPGRAFVWLCPVALLAGTPAAACAALKAGNLQLFYCTLCLATHLAGAQEAMEPSVSAWPSLRVASSSGLASGHASSSVCRPESWQCAAQGPTQDASGATRASSAPADSQQIKMQHYQALTAGGARPKDPPQDASGAIMTSSAPASARWVSM